MFETLSLFAALLVGLLLPGWLLIRLFFPKQFTPLEESLYSLALGFTLTDALFLVLDHFHIPLSFTVITSTLVIINLLLMLLLWYRIRKSSKNSEPKEESALTVEVALSSKTWGILFLMLLITIGIRAYYLIPAGLPTTTDMGHHMYWSEYINKKSTLPEYQKISVVRDAESGVTSITEP